MAVGGGADQADRIQAAAGGDGGEEAGDLGAAGDPVPFEYSIEWLTWTVTDKLDPVMVGWEGASQDRLRAGLADTWPGRRAVPRQPGDSGRSTGAPARECGAPPTGRPGAVRTDGPGLVRRAGTDSVTPALGRDISRHARDAHGLAPQAGGEEVRHERTAQAWLSSGHPKYQAAGAAPGTRESAVGPSPDPGRVGEARHRRGAVHSLGDPARRRRRSGPAPLGPHLAAVSVYPGRRDSRGRFPARGHRAVQAPVRTGVHRHGTRRMHGPSGPRQPSTTRPISAPANGCLTCPRCGRPASRPTGACQAPRGSATTPPARSPRSPRSATPSPRHRVPRSPGCASPARAGNPCSPPSAPSSCRPAASPAATRAPTSRPCPDGIAPTSPAGRSPTTSDGRAFTASSNASPAPTATRSPPRASAPPCSSPGSTSASSYPASPRSQAPARQRTPHPAPPPAPTKPPSMTSPATPVSLPDNPLTRQNRPTTPNLTRS